MRGVLIGLSVICGLVPLAAQGARPEMVEDRTNVERLLRTLAHDSMEGRATATPGAARAAQFIAAEMHRIGLSPMGDDGYFQRVPMAMVASNRPPRAPRGCVAGTFRPQTDTMATPLWRCAGADGGPESFRVPPVSPPRLTSVASFTARDSMPAAARRLGRNVVGMIPGSDPDLTEEVILVMAHYDHLGIRAPGVGGDSIYNGADDDASGTVAVMEIARAMMAGPRPKRTILFAAMTGEEMGLVGTRYFIDHPPISLDRVVAGFEIEMIGRPDSLAGGWGKAWLTGYERSTMGDMLRDNGIPIVPDPRPDQNFFRRSDNYAFARMGIVAHTLSTFNLHSDYHRPSDEADAMDFGHMTAVIAAAAEAVRHLADGPTPAWHPGGKPE